MRWAAKAAIHHSAFNSDLFFKTEATLRARLNAGLPQQRLIVSEPQRLWADAVKKRIDELCTLPHNWNGYGARAVSFSTANFALRMLETCCATSTPAPSIIPGVNGDLQIEWHLPGVDVEIHVRAPYDVHAWRYFEADDREEELALTNDVTAIGQWMKEMGELQLAFVPAAA